MSKKSGYIHLTIEQRKTIESLLSQETITLKNIAQIIDHSSKCVRYEIKRHRQISIRSNQHNKCGRQSICQIKRCCTHCINGLCKECKYDNCNEICSSFIETPVCKRTSRFPFVCSSCKKIESCKLPKFFYVSTVAQREYERNKTTWREGPKKGEREMKVISDSISTGAKNGQSLDVIIKTNDLPISPSTAYRYIKKHHIAGIINLDLKRQVSYAIRAKSKPMLTPINYDYLENRRYSDFVELIANSDCPSNIWEMDTVIGKKECDEKCVLTLLHRSTNLQLCFILGSKTMSEVNTIFTFIKSTLGDDLFKESFPVILTDNGSEFHDPLSLETSVDTGEQLIQVFFCEARRSDQKGKCEKNHVHLRELLPKGISMNSLTQKDLNFVSGMINNYPRPKFNYNSPFEIASRMINKKVLELNKIKYIPTKDVVLKPIIK